MSRSIFISHAVKDKDLVENFVDNILQVGMGIPAEDIFCSSLSGMGIPSGKNFIDYIKEEIQQPKVVIVFFSKAYISSQFCMCELGATCAMTHNILPILVHPLTYSDIKGVLTGIQVDKLNNAEDLNRFQESLSNILGKNISFSRWERKRNKFLKESESILKEMMEEIKKEKDLDYLNLERKYEDAQKEIKEFEYEISKKDDLIARLNQCKDADEVQSIINSIDLEDEELFNSLISDVNKVLKELPDIVVYVIYKEVFAKTSVSFNAYEERYLLEAAIDSSENKFLINDQPYFYLNEEDQKVNKALESISKLKKFLEEDIDTNFFNKLDDENGYTPCLDNKRFWKKYLINSRLL